MIKKITYSILTTIFGVFMLSFPAFLNYLNSNTLFFDLAKFLNDYPAFRFIIGILFVVAGVMSSIYLIFLKKYKTIFVIQESGDGDYGNPDLHYCSSLISDKNEVVYTNLATLNYHPDDVIQLEKKQIRLFYEKLPKQRKIAFLSVATIPSIVYAGYVIGENGRRINYYHWNREKNKAKKLFGFRQNCKLSITEKIDSSKNANDYVVYISASYLPNKEQIFKQFGDVNYIFCQTDKIGVDVVKTTKDLKDISNQVKDVIAGVMMSGAVIHLILQCSSEVCFAIGQKLNTPAVSKIRIYSFNNKKTSNPWDWYIEI